MSDLDSKAYRFSSDDQLARWNCPKTEALAKEVAKAMQAAGIPIMWFRGLRVESCPLDTPVLRADVAYADTRGVVQQVCTYFPEVLAPGQLEARISSCVLIAKESP